MNVDESIVAAVVHCRLGSWHKFLRECNQPPRGPDFYRAKELGLLAHDPVWHATPQGEGLLIGLGLMEGKPAPTLRKVYVLWAVSEIFPPNFVAAFCEGIVEHWPSMYQQRRAEAEQRFVDFGDEPASSWRFFTTVETLPEPERAAWAGLGT